MSKFRTETVSQQLRILLIANPGEITSLLLSSIQNQGLQVLEIQPEQLISNTQLISNLKQEQFYKVIWIYGFSDLDYQTAKLIVDFIQAKDKIPIIVNHYLLEPDVSSPIWEDWSVWSLNLKRIKRYLQSKIKLYKEFSGQNVWLENSFLSPYKDCLKGYKNSVFFDPQTEFYVQSGKNFVDLIAKELFRPNKNKYLIKGKKIDSTVFLQKIIDKINDYYHKKIQLKKFPLELKQSEVLYGSFVKAKSDVNLNELIEKISRVIPNINLALSTEARKELNSTWLKTEVVEDRSVFSEQDSFTPSTPPQLYSQQQQEKKRSQAKKQNIYYERQVETKIIQRKKIESKKQKKTSDNKNVFLEEEPILITGDENLTEKKKECEKKEKKPEKEVDSELKRLFSDKRVKQKVERRVKKASLINKIKGKSKRTKVVFFAGVFLFLIGLGLGVNFLVFVINFKSSQVSLISQLESRQEKKNNPEVSAKLPLKIKTLQKQTVFLDKIVDLSIIDKSKNLVDLYTAVDSYLGEESSYYQNKAKLVSLIWGSGLQDPQQVLNQYHESVSRVYEKTSFIQAELKNINTSFFKSEEQKTIQDFRESLELQRKSLAKEQQLAGVMDKLLGLERQIAVWLVLQDNQELRPTGGFIQGFAKITLNNGSIIDQQVFNVNQIDKNLMGNIEAPAELTALLGEERLYLRDSNWDPDFPATAEQISWFIKESLNQPVDIVIGINYELIQDLLGIVGEVHLERYDENINKQNLYERLKYHAGEEKEEQLAENYHFTILESVLNKLSLASDQQKLETMEALKDSFEEKQTVISASEDVNSVLQTLSWTGAIIDPTCPSQFAIEGFCQPDTLYQVETNIGINKVNPYITRNLIHKIMVEENQITHERTSTIKNNAFSQSWPLGTYKSYFRFYLTSESVLNEVKINGNRVSEEKLIQYQTHQRKVVGVVVDTPIQQETELTISYQVPFSIEKQASYLFFDQQQPGVNFENKLMEISHSSSLVPVLIAPRAEIVDGIINFSSTQRDHLYFGVLFEKPTKDE